MEQKKARLKEHFKTMINNVQSNTNASGLAIREKNCMYRALRMLPWDVNMATLKDNAIFFRD
jgi:hypothetical protein